MSNCVGFQIKPIPDETFFGLLVAAGILAGCETYTQVFRRLLGDLRTCPASMLPRGLDKLARHLPDRYQKDIEAVCHEHTAFPYFHHFAQPEVISKVLQAMLGSLDLNVHCAIGLTNSKIRVEQNLKYCCACANEQWVQYDRATWLRSHQLPGVEVCHKHGLPLIETSISTARHGTHSDKITLPPNTESTSARNIWSAGDAWDKSSPNRLISQLSHELLCTQPLPNSPLARAKAYRSAFINAGCGKNNVVDWERVAGTLREKYGDLIPRRLGVDFMPRSASHWIHQIATPQGGIQHPLQHILIIGAFFGSIGQLRKEMANEAKKLLDKAAFLSDVARQTTSQQESIDVNSLYCRNLELHRQLLMNALSHCQHLSRSEIHNKIGHANYKWMLRNDRRWLESHLPAKRAGCAMMKKTQHQPSPRIDWAYLDKKMATHISTLSPIELVRKLRNQFFINIAHLARLMGLSYTTTRRLISFPHTSEAVRTALAQVTK